MKGHGRICVLFFLYINIEETGKMAGFKRGNVWGYLDNYPYVSKCGKLLTKEFMKYL